MKDILQNITFSTQGRWRPMAAAVTMRHSRGEPFFCSLFCILGRFSVSAFLVRPARGPVSATTASHVGPLRTAPSLRRAAVSNLEAGDPASRVSNLEAGEPAATEARDPLRGAVPRSRLFGRPLRRQRSAAAPPPSPRSRRWRPRTAAMAGLPRRGLDASSRDSPNFAAVARRLRHGLDAGGRRPPLWPGRRPRRPRTATVARLPRPGLDAGSRGPPRCPAAFTAVSTPAAVDHRGGPPPSPRSRRQQPRSATVPRRLRHGLGAGSRGQPQRRPRSLV